MTSVFTRSLGRPNESELPRNIILKGPYVESRSLLGSHINPQQKSPSLAQAETGGISGNRDLGLLVDPGKFRRIGLGGDAGFTAP